MNATDLNKVRTGALDKIEASRKSATRFLMAAGVFELVLMVAIFVLMDLSNELHLLVFFCSCLVYGTLAFGLFALKSYVDLSTLRVLNAIDLGRGATDLDR